MILSAAGTENSTGGLSKVDPACACLSFLERITAIKDEAYSSSRFSLICEVEVAASQGVGRDLLCLTGSTPIAAAGVCKSQGLFFAFISNLP